MKPLISKTRSAIIYGKNCGQSGRTIAKKLGCDKTAVYDVLKRFHEADSSIPKKRRTGRPPLLNTPSQQELKAFVQKNAENHWLCSAKLATVWTVRTNKPISEITIRQNLKKVGLNACMPRHKPAITKAHC